MEEPAAYRSIGPLYVPHIIKEYKHWTLLVSDNQNYLGRMVVWLVRPGEMQELVDLSDEEYDEQRLIWRGASRALMALWQPDRMNYGWLGNLINLHKGHGHWHVIPRYKSARTFNGRVYEDGRWGENYSPKDTFAPPEQELYVIRDAIRAALE